MAALLLKKKKEYKQKNDSVGRICQMRMQELCLFSKPLFVFAWKGAQTKGRGCIVALWTTVQQAEDPKSVRPTFHYFSSDEAASLEYQPLIESMECVGIEYLWKLLHCCICINFYVVLDM